MALDDIIKIEKEGTTAPVQTRTKAYNLLWIPPRFPKISIFEPTPEDRPFCQPIPDKTVENMLRIAEQNEQVDVRLWVDSERLNRAQMEWLREMAGKACTRNMQILDLESISEYRSDQWFHQPDLSQNWRHNKHSLIWRQVDTARILAGVQGDYEQSFYSDADVTNLIIDSQNVQEQLQKHGVIVSGWPTQDGAGYENQLFGFTRERKSLFFRLYEQTLEYVKSHGRNGYDPFIIFINSKFKDEEKIDTREIVFSPEYDDTRASHPGLDIHCPLPKNERGAVDVYQSTIFDLDSLVLLSTEILEKTYLVKAGIAKYSGLMLFKE